MKIVLCYVCVTHGVRTEEFAARFVTTYREYPPGVEHDTIIICNGGPLKTSTTVLFSGMSAKMFPRENDGGWDISGYIDAARGPCSGYDAMMCLGESNYFHREGWLKRFEDAWKRIGPGMYGPYASHAVRAHLNTTAFFTAPIIVGKYPFKVTCRQHRYEFEHGENALWRRVQKRSMPVRLVTWDGEWLPRHWRIPNNILWRGDQSNCLMWCNHTDNYAAVDSIRKASWARSADRAFK